MDDYAKSVGYPIDQCQQIACSCGATKLRLFSDDNEGGAVAECPQCDVRLEIAESSRYLVSPVQNICTCDSELLSLELAYAFYSGTMDPRWVYVGGGCDACGTTGVYVDWQER